MAFRHPYGSTWRWFLNAPHKHFDETLRQHRVIRHGHPNERVHYERGMKRMDRLIMWRTILLVVAALSGITVAARAAIGVLASASSHLATLELLVENPLVAMATAISTGILPVMTILAFAIGRTIAQSQMDVIALAVAMASTEGDSEPEAVEA